VTNPSPSRFSRILALQHRDFRLLWTGQTLSSIGSQMQVIVVNWHVFEILRGQEIPLTVFNRTFNLGAEALGLGTLGLVRIVPIFVLALVGGMLADASDRRRVLFGTNIAAALFAGILAGATLLGYDRLWLLYALTAAGAATAAFGEPAEQSLVPNLVPREHLSNAISLNTLRWYGASIIGPGLAGILVSLFDIGLVYAVNTLSFGAMLVALALISYQEPIRVDSEGLGLGALRSGLRFTFGTPIIFSTMLLDFFATFFSSARTMLPIIADQILGVGVTGYGILAAAQSVGAVLAGGYLAVRPELRRQGWILLISVGLYGIATALFGLSTAFVLSFLLFAATGAADTISTVIRGTIRQLNTPDALRGRMTGVNMMFFMGGPQLGELEAGLVASAFGAPFAIVTGGIATLLLTAAVAWRYPSLRRYDH
jgi:MFS family permease